MEMDKNPIMVGAYSSVIQKFGSETQDLKSIDLKENLRVNRGVVFVRANLKHRFKKKKS